MLAHMQFQRLTKSTSCYDFGLQGWSHFQGIAQNKTFVSDPIKKVLGKLFDATF